MSREKSYKMSVRLLDRVTGEIFSSKEFPVTMFCEGDGERALFRWLECYKRGLRKTDGNMSLEIDMSPIQIIKQPLIF